jgi:SAM-dependent methyltransferase
VTSEHDEIYEDTYFDFVEKTTGSSAEAIAESIMAELAPRSVVDLGCGTGALIDRLRARGVSVKGLEYARSALAYCRARGLDVEPFNIETDTLPDRFRGADVGVSMEVGQQLDPAVSGRYVDLLCSIAGTIVFSSAVPGQGDKAPRNEQPHAFWIGEFAARGYTFDEPTSLAWRAAWESKGTSRWFFRNVMVFRRTPASRAVPT